MKKGVFRLCAGLLAVVLLSVAVVPCYAESDKYTSTGTFWQAVADKWYFNGTVIPAIIGTVSDKVCSESGDKKHHGSLKSYEQNPDKSYTAICDFCSAEFPVYDADLSAAYDNYVETLPAPGYTSDGSLQYSPVHGYFWFRHYVGSSDIHFGCEHSSKLVSSSFDKCSFNFNCASNSFSVFPFSGKQVFFGISATIYYSCVAPIDGYYSISDTKGISGYFLNAEGLRRSLDKNWSISNSSTYYSAGSTFTVSFSVPSFSSAKTSAKFAFIQGIPPVYKITPVSALSGDTYNINTRPTSITDGNYGIVGDNGQITKVEDNSTIINETNNTFYNPATGTTVPIVNWSYDYSDRSYKVTLESGDTATITYGDENITISQITTTEGDTITNNYTIYYLIDGSGSVTPPCEHDWQEASGTDPTCTLPGKVTLSCAKCQQTKTETLPALGHDWQVKQTVTTQYDDTGQLIQEGYTIFECSRCKEQYKSPDGSIPPGGGSGTDPGGEEEGGGFLSWLFGKLGELLGTIGNGILNLLQTALEKIFGGLIDLVNSLFENLAKLVDLFGSVGEAFQVLWTWLPPEVTAILVAGVSIFVFVALLKFFMK